MKRADPPDQITAENGTWQRVDGVWRRVYGSFFSKGVSIEWHDFRLDAPLKIAPSFHPNSLEICLNFSGQADFGRRKSDASLDPSQVAIYTTSEEDALDVSRKAEGSHRFLTIEFSAEYLARQFGGFLDSMKPEVRGFIDGKSADPILIERDSLPPHLLMFREHVMKPPVPDSALPIWCDGKIAEVIASLLFSPTRSAELFCESHHRKNRQLAEQMLHILECDFANPPGLDLLATRLQQSPFHLSRIFSEITGLTIPAALRKIRLTRAASLLRDTQKPITEIAFEVGYSSIGAFNKAFRDQFQSTPSAYRKKPVSH